jgi:molybdenum cofactor guanylyltransferase
MAGLSSRMGRDKAFLLNHNQAQWQFLADLVRPFTKQVYLNARSDQTVCYRHVIIDNSHMGPMGGLVSADTAYPNQSWLVIACDMPFLKPKDIKTLLENRAGKGVAYLINNSIEPLCTLYEAAALNEVQKEFSRGQYSLKSCIEKMDFNLLDGAKANMQNCNTPKDWPQKKPN